MLKTQRLVERINVILVMPIKKLWIQNGLCNLLHSKLQYQKSWYTLEKHSNNVGNCTEMEKAYENRIV